MTELKITISDDLAQKIEKYPEINWNSVASNAIRAYLMKLELNEEPIKDEELTKFSEYSLKEFLENEPDIYTDRDLIKRYK
jgi:hypothetical protein